MLSQLLTGDRPEESVTNQFYLMEKEPNEKQAEEAHKQFDLLKYVVETEDYGTGLRLQKGLINLDFADIRTVMSEMGKAMMGTGEASGEKRAVDAAESAIKNPLLDDMSMKGARGVLAE